LSEKDASESCKKSGGYLAKLDGTKEFEFVNRLFVKEDVSKAWVHSWNGDSYEEEYWSGKTKKVKDVCIVYNKKYEESKEGKSRDENRGGSITAEECDNENYGLCEFDKPKSC